MGDYANWSFMIATDPILFLFSSPSQLPQPAEHMRYDAQKPVIRMRRSDGCVG
jgi:hypothetical protein